MSTDDARRRVEYQAVGGALAALDAKNPRAAQLISGLTRVIIDEAERSSRFAGALVDVVSALAPSSDALPAAVAPPPRKRASTPRKKVVRQPAVLDPFVVYRETGSVGLTTRLSELDIEQLRDIIAEEELDTRKETARKRSPAVITAWIVERVEASENKGRVFR